MNNELEKKLQECDSNFALSKMLIDRYSPSRKTLSPKDVIYNIGEESDSVFYILKGMVKLVSDLSNGTSRIVRLHNQGSWLGLCRLLDEPYQHTAIALDNVEVLQVGVEKLKSLRNDEPHTYAEFLEYWYEYLSKADIWITEFSTGALKSRLARLLNHLDEIEQEHKDERVKLLTCEEMAQILGATTESVSRLLAEFKREDILISTNTEGVFDLATDDLNEISDK